MPGRLILIAHAETAARRGVFVRDEGLSASGRAAATALRHAIPRFDAAVMAPNAAASETAAAFGIEATAETALRDIDFGTWAGRPLAEIATTDPVGTSAFALDPTFAGHGGESIAAVCARLGPWLERRRAGSTVTVAIVSAAIAKAAATVALDAPPTTFWHLDVALLDAVTLGSDGRRWTLRRLGPLA